MKIAPTIFVIKVINGNSNFIDTKLNKYLRIAPIPPPKPTNNISFTLFFHSNNTKSLIFFNQCHCCCILYCI